MAQPLITCPLCSSASFSNTSSLCLSLVNVASKLLRCTVCEEELRGLDKFTIHLLGHLIHTPEFKKFLDNGNIAPNTSLVSNSQPLNLIKEQVHEPSKQDLVEKRFNEALEGFPSQTDIRSERPSLKIDDEVMIFFNCNNSNEGLQIKSGETNVVRALDKEISSSSGLPKFTINFDKTTTNQVEDASNSENKITLSGENSFQENLENEALQCFLSNASRNDESVNSNFLVPNQDNELQMEFSDNDKDKEPLSSLPDTKNMSDTRIEMRNSTALVCSNSEGHPGNKSSFLSPKGERVLGFRCDICSLVFPDEYILTMHRQLIHIELHGSPSEPTSYKCHLCSKSFVMKGSLMVHMRVAHFGGAVVARLVEAKQLETDAVSPDSAQFICSICNKGFQKEQQLTQHEKLHDGKQCDVCLKTFTTKYFLRKHKRLHTGEMPYQCRECNKSFTFQQSYHKHLLYHSDDKPYSCGDCGRAFKELSTLHNHQRIHTGEKPFSCETCGKCFRQRVSYLVHRRIHTGVMPYRCQDCGKTFRYKVSERTHKCTTSSTSGSSDVSSLPLPEARQETGSSGILNEKETQRSSEDKTEVKPAPSVEGGQDLYPGPADFFSLVMSPSDRLQHLTLTSDSLEDSSSPVQRESIDSEALKQLLYDVADYT